MTCAACHQPDCSHPDLVYAGIEPVREGPASLGALLDHILAPLPPIVPTTPDSGSL